MDNKYNRLTEDLDTENRPEAAVVRSKERGRKICLKVALVLVIAIVLSMVGLALSLLLAGRLSINNNGSLKYQITVKGESNVMQHVHSSVSGNYVEYYIELSDSEKTWILDDFNTDLQVIRNEADGNTICYVSALNRSEAMAPTSEQPKFTPYKNHYHGVYSPDEMPTEDKSFLGPLAQQLCSDVNLYWLHPMETIEVSEISSNTSMLMSHHEHERSKRNIRRCTTSCCWLVCCCNTRRFNWESSGYFSCRHICDKCTKAYKQKIQKLC